MVKCFFLKSLMFILSETYIWKDSFVLYIKTHMWYRNIRIYHIYKYMQIFVFIHLHSNLHKTFRIVSNINKMLKKL